MTRLRAKPSIHNQVRARLAAISRCPDRKERKNRARRSAYRALPTTWRSGPSVAAKFGRVEANRRQYPAASAFLAHRSRLKNVSRQALVPHDATIWLRYGGISTPVQLLDAAPKLGAR